MRLTILKILTIVFVIAGLISCGEKKHEHQDHDSATVADPDEWTEMDEFHMVMAESYHPFKDSANLQPARDQIKNMVSVAEKWAVAPLPERVNNEKVKAKIIQLKEEVLAFEKTVNENNDQAIGESLEQLHDRFHEVQDAWYHSEDHSGHSHEH